MWRCGLDVFASEWYPMAGSCEKSNEIAGFIQGRVFD